MYFDFFFFFVLCILIDEHYFCYGLYDQILKNCGILRASTTGVANVPNAKYLAHLPHQTQKWSFMRCAKSQKLYNMATVPLQICNGTDRCCKSFIILYFLFSLLSLHFFFSLLSHSPVPSFFSLYRFHLSSTSPGCSPSATTA